MKKILTLVVVGLVCFSQTGCSGNLVDTVLADLPIATDIAVSIVNIVSSGNASYAQEITEYAGKVTADVKLIESLVGQYRNILGAQPGATAALPVGVPAQIGAALSDAQANLSLILKAAGAGDPKVASAVAAAVGSVKLILNDVELLVKNSTPPVVTAQLFVGVGMPVEITENQGTRDRLQEADQRTQPRAAAVQSPGNKPSGKSARQIAKEYNQKIAKDFPNAKVNVPKAHVAGVPVPMTGTK